MFASTLVALAALATSAQAAIYATSPVASTSWVAGQPQTITWQDDGSSPSLKDFGPAKVMMSVGNAITQTPLQLIADNVDVSTTASIVYTPDPTVGKDGPYYFIRFESLSLKDAAQPQFPGLGFSAKFTLTGMSGNFNATVQQQIDGASTAPLGGPTSSASATFSTAGSTVPAKAVATTSHSSAAASQSAKTTQDSGALSNAVSSFFAVTVSVIAIAAAMAF